MAMSATRDYVSLGAAARLLGTTEGKVKGYAERRLIGVQRLPDLPPRYCRSDLLALRERCTTPASAEAVCA